MEPRQEIHKAKHQLLIDLLVTVSPDWPVFPVWIDYREAYESHMDSLIPTTVQDKQDPKSLHQKFDDHVMNNTKGQLQANNFTRHQA